MAEVTGGGTTESMGAETVATTTTLGLSSARANSSTRVNAKRVRFMSRARVRNDLEDLRLSTMERGASVVEYPSGQTVLLKYLTREQRQSLPLPIGTTVHRHLVNGDVVIFNRQPSLHQHSMMAFRARLYPEGRAFGLPPATTVPFNADFDGDEMNAHFAQSEQARAEALVLMGVNEQIISVQNAQPSMSIVQDAHTQAWRCSSRDTFYTEEQFMQIAAQVRHVRPSIQQHGLPRPAVLKPKRLYTGKQLWTLLLRDEIEVYAPWGMRAQQLFDDLEETHAVVRRGELLVGRPNKSMIVRGKNGFVQLMSVYVSKIEATRFLENAQAVFNHALQSVGFTSSLRHMLPPLALEQMLQATTENTLDKLARVLRQPACAKIAPSVLETKINAVLQELMQLHSKVLLTKLQRADDGSENCVISMIRAGSKGSPMNIMQIAGMLGQQSVQDGRVLHGAELTAPRALPSFAAGDIGPEACGFIANGYLSGMTPEEASMHDMAGREGLVNTSVRTAQSGTIQRRMIGMLQPHRTSATGATMYSQTLMQLEYGGDGYDMTRVHRVLIPPILLADTDICAEFDHVDPTLTLELLRARNVYRRTSPFVIMELPIKVLLPFDMRRILSAESSVRSDNQNGVMGSATADLSAGPLHERIVPSNWKQFVRPRITEFFQFCQRHRRAPTLLSLFMSVVWCLRPNELMQLRCTLGALDRSMKRAKDLFERALIDANEVVGVQAAQSIGEPQTQNTLNSFHSTGVADSVKVVYGFKRWQEVLHSTSTSNDMNRMETPSMEIAIHPAHNHRLTDKHLKRNIRRLITSKLSDLVAVPVVVCDPVRVDGETLIVSDRPLVHRCNRTYGTEYSWISSLNSFGCQNMNQLAQAHQWLQHCKKTVNYANVSTSDDTVTTGSVDTMGDFLETDCADKGQLFNSSSPPQDNLSIPSWMLATHAIRRPDSVGRVKNRQNKRKRSDSSTEKASAASSTQSPTAGERTVAGDAQSAATGASETPSMADMLLIDVANAKEQTAAVLREHLPSRFVIRFTLNRARAQASHLTPRHIARAISNVLKRTKHFTIQFSEPSDSVWIVRVRCWNNEDDYACRKLLLQIMKHAHMNGVPEVKKAVTIRKPVQTVDPRSRKLVQTDRRCVITEGHALMDIAGMPWIDWPNTLTNHIVATYHTLGVHAATVLITRELFNVVCAENKDTVNIRHLGLLASSMTVTGDICPVTRNGFGNTPQIGVLATAAFQKVTDTLAEAAAHGSCDTMLSTTENVICGQRAPIGTGCVGIITSSLLPNDIRPFESGFCAQRTGTQS